MMYLQLFIILCQILIFVRSGSLQHKLIRKQKVEIVRLDGLCGGKDVPVLNYFHGTSSDTTEAHCANATLVIKEDIVSTDYKCSFKVDKCASRENLDSCEQVYQRDNFKICQLINANSITPGPLAVPYKPPVKCPGKKGISHAYNFTINLIPLLFFPLDDWYWKLNMSVFSPDYTRLVGCGFLEARLARSSHV